MADQNICVMTVNHVGIDIAAPPAVVWRLILDEFAEAKRWREMGYAIEPLDDPAAVLGGYRMRLEQDGNIVDDRVCQITEIDQTERRLSLVADYLSAPAGVLVHVTYHAQQTEVSTRYTVDCHVRMGIGTPAGGTKADISAAIDEIRTHSETHLTGYLERTKARLEAVS